MILMISLKTLESRLRPSFSDLKEVKLRKISLMARNSLALEGLVPQFKKV